MADHTGIDSKDLDKIGETVRKLNALIEGDPRPFLAAIGAKLLSHTNRVFESSGREGSGKWEKLKLSTIQSRQKKGYAGRIILVNRGFDGGLRGSIISQLVNKNTVQVGVAGVADNLKRAFAHQKGTDKAGRNKKVRIPKREFLVLTPKIIGEIEEDFKIKLTEKIDNI